MKGFGSEVVQQAVADTQSARQPMIPYFDTLRWAAIALAIPLFLLSLCRSNECAGQLAERLEIRDKANEIQRRMLEAAARRPRDRDELVERLRDGEF